MNATDNSQHIDTALKSLWGASQMPFGPAAPKPYLSPRLQLLLNQLAQMAALRSTGILQGPNGVGKTFLVQQFLSSLPDKRFKTFLLTHSSVTATDLLRLLCRQLGLAPRNRRSDNIALIHQGWQACDRLWPVLVLEEAQNFSALALEELRLLTCQSNDTQPPFSLLLVGDQQLLPRLQMGINAPLLSRLSFCLHLDHWSPTELAQYVKARLQQVGIHSDLFEPQALQLLIQAANGSPRLLNHLAQRAIQQAIDQNSQTISSAHLQQALDLLPWLAQLHQSP